MSYGRAWATGLIHLAAGAAVLLAGCVIDVVGEDEVGDAPGCEAARRWPHVYADREEVLFDLVNDARAVGGMCGDQAESPVPGLDLAPALRCAARVHAVDLADNEMLSHTGSDGSSQFDRIDRAQYPEIPKAELLAADFTDPAEVLEAWLDDPVSCAVLYDTRITEVGIGHAENADGDATGWVLWTGETRQ